jgi:hypothetical protein
MSQNLDLKAIERKAFRSVYKDGLWDIYIGIILLVCSQLLAIPDNEDFPLPTMLLSLAGLVIAFGVYHLGKRFVTAPRMGLVKFGPERQKRKVTLAWIMSMYLLVTLGVFLFSLYLWNAKNPVLTENWMMTVGMERLLVATLAALIVGTSTIVISYFKDFVRGYYIALVMGAGFFLALWLDTPIFIVIAAVLILLPGLALFVNFLRQHPLPPREASHDNS